jgi:hypothetical protein
MTTTNPIFSSKTFWELYLFLESDSLEEADVKEQLNLLKEDFTVRTQNIEFEYQKQKHNATVKTVEFNFNCGNRYTLTLDYSPAVSGCEQSLYLTEKSIAEKYQLGWWDVMRWHPFCLKPDEFESLLEYWERFDSQWKESDLPLLLLFNFVGFEEIETAGNLISRVKNALDKLGIKDFETDPTESLKSYVDNKNFIWKFDEKLGWLFESESYPCYSLRNKSHSDSTEENFPFDEYNQMMAEIRQNLGHIG